jgi:hypothetical protein
MRNYAAQAAAAVAAAEASVAAAVAAVDAEGSFEWDDDLLDQYFQATKDEDWCTIRLLRVRRDSLLKWGSGLAKSNLELRTGLVLCQRELAVSAWASLVVPQCRERAQ